MLTILHSFLLDEDSCPYDVHNDADSDSFCSEERISFSRLDSLQLLREAFVPGSCSKVSYRACTIEAIDCIDTEQVEKM